MKLKIGRPLFIYFCTSMITIMTLASFGIYYYWSKGTANVENMALIFDSTREIEELEKMNGVDRVKDYVQNDKLREAITTFDAYVEKVKSLNSTQSSDEFEVLNDSLNETKNTLSKLLAHTSKTTLIEVLRAKTIAFENFVVHNNWRTLSRVAEKVNAKISAGAISSPGFFTYSKMRALHSSLVADIKYMENVTTSSVLSQEDKNLIVLRLNTLNTELDMLKESLDTMSGFSVLMNKVEKNYDAWLVKVKPSLTAQKVSLIKNSQTILYGMLGFFGVVIALFAVGYVVYAKMLKAQAEEVEGLINETIKDGLIPLNSNLAGKWSVDFKDQLEKYREYVHKRMSFGSIFQDAMPFSSILLDSNLNLVWANALFYEHWSLEDTMKANNSLTWDSLQRYTNLGENDPVVEAMRENIAGIYQIQVKTKSSEEAAPFEMYVSPVEYAGQKRIMVIFYPLRSLEETLGNQMKSLVSPVSKTLDAVVDSKFSGEYKERLQADFEAAGIDHIYKKFDKLNDYFINQRNGLMKEIEEIENTLFEQYKLTDDVKISLDGQKDLQNEAVNKFTFAKENIISVVDLRSQFESMLVQMGEITEKLFGQEVSLLSKASDVNEILNENSRALDSLVKSRDEFKKLKSSVEMHKTRVSNILEQSRNSDSPTKVAEGLTRLKSEMLEFDNALTAFSKVTTSLDVGLSKIQIIMKSKEMPNLAELKSSFEALRRDLGAILQESTKLGRIGQEKDEELIKSLKGLYLSFQNLRSRSKEIDEIFEAPLETMNQIQPVYNEIAVDSEIV